MLTVIVHNKSMWHCCIPQGCVTWRIWLSVLMLTVIVHSKTMWHWRFGSLWWCWQWLYTTRRTQQDNVTLTLWLSMVMLSDCTQQDNVTLTLWLSVVMLTVNVHNKTYTTRQCDTDFLAVCGDVDSDRHVHYTTTRWEIIEPRRDILNLYPVVSGADSWRFTQPCTLWGILLDRASLIVYGPDGYLCNCW